MTVIAWDGKTLAADRRMGSYCHRSVTKIRRSIRTGALLGASGSGQGGRELMEWYEQGAIPEKWPQFHRSADEGSILCAVTKEGRVFEFGASPHAIEILDSSYSLGSGRDVARTAMHLGLDARRAVEIANELCTECGNGIDTLTLEPTE